LWGAVISKDIMKKFLKEECNLIQLTKIGFAIYAAIILWLIYKK